MSHVGVWGLAGDGGVEQGRVEDAAWCLVGEVFLWLSGVIHQVDKGICRFVDVHSRSASVRSLNLLL